MLAVPRTDTGFLAKKAQPLRVKDLKEFGKLESTLWFGLRRVVT